MVEIIKGIPVMEVCSICDMPLWEMDFGYACLECRLHIDIQGQFRILSTLTSEEVKIITEELLFGSF